MPRIFDYLPFAFYLLLFVFCHLPPIAGCAEGKRRGRLDGGMM